VAKKSSIEKNDRRKKLTAQFATKRAKLKEVVRSPKSTDAERAAALVGLQKLPRLRRHVRAQPYRVPRHGVERPDPRRAQGELVGVVVGSV
jgi:predicted aminopeptidase